MDFQKISTLNVDDESKGTKDFLIKSGFEPTVGHKPDPDPLFKYMEVSNASNNELIYIGDSVYDWECAKSAKVDFALAGWGSFSREIQADYYLEKLDDLLSIMRD